MCFTGQRVLPVGAGIIGKEALSARRIGELSRAGYEARMDVRFGNVRDLNALKRGGFDIMIDVGIWIHDHRDFLMFAGD